MTLFCDIDPMLDALKVLARCISIWKSHPANKPNEVWSSDVVFQDAQMLLEPLFQYSMPFLLTMLDKPISEGL
nr:replication protein A 70 kDa DNA-binding subunit B [Tanacetum cinerariifolium]